MKRITISGPDKVSLATFMDFLKFCLGSAYVPVMLHSLMSKECINNLIENAIAETENLIFSYYAKRRINVDPMKVIPEKLLEVSEAVIWFDLYSVDFKLIKDDVGFEAAYKERWKQNIARIDNLMQRG